MALQKAEIEAMIYEAYDRPADYVGSFLNTASNGLDALQTLDSHTRVLAEGFATHSMVIWSGNGKRLGEVANGVNVGRWHEQHYPQARPASSGSTRRSIQPGNPDRAGQAPCRCHRGCSRELKALAPDAYDLVLSRLERNSPKDQG
jgi:hypothetical protein